MIRKNNGNGKLAISQIAILLVSIVAISYILGGSVPVVSAAGEQCIRWTDIRTTDQSGINGWCEGRGSGHCDPIGETWKLKNYVEIVDCPAPTGGGPSIAVNPASAVEAVAGRNTGKTPGEIFNEAFDKAIDDKKSPEEAAEIALKASTPSGLAKFLGKARIGELSIGGILKTAGVAAAIYGGLRIILPLLGASPEFTSAFSFAAASGYFAGSIATKIGASLLQGGLIGLGIGALIFLVTFKKTRYEVASFSCYPWDAPVGGQNCGECNDENFACTEYRCRSLGQACELINKGTNEELCFWNSHGDVKPPVIEAWEETLTPGYKYIPDNAISPPDRGVEIVGEFDNGCVAPFTALRFGINVDEPAKCKLDSLNKDNFDEMSFFFGRSSTNKFNHSQTMSLPSRDALESENITLQNGGQFQLYARCQDANGNSNVPNFVFSFCVDEGQDTTPPLIKSTSIINGNPIAFNQNDVDLDVFVNEPAECKWSRTNQGYDNMENQMDCNTNVLEVNGQGLYECSTTLTGLNDGVDNDFYFRCKDQPHLEGTADASQRNKNAESYKFTLVGTRSLVIDSFKPNGTIKDSTDPIKVTLEVKTSAGYSNGESICEYEGFGTGGNFNQFQITSAHEHSQRLDLPEGDYTYNVRCVDLGGNTDTAETEFTIETDTAPPSIIRVFHEETLLKIRTNEEASCVYSNFGCSYPFEEGTAMSTLDDKEHSTAWNPDKSFHIKCEDEFGNRPVDPSSCSLIVRPFEV